MISFSSVMKGSINMSNDPDLFSSESNSDSEEPKQLDPNKNYLEELVGDGKKFQDAASLARGKAESDLFIDRLQEENKQMRDRLAQFQTEVETRKTVEENIQSLMDRMRENSSSSSNDSNSDAHNQGDSSNDQGTNESGITLEDVQKVLEKQLEQRDAHQTQHSNLTKSQRALQEAYGNDWKSKSEQRMTELGIGKEFANNLAKEQPNAFIALMIPSTSHESKGESSSELFKSGDVDLSSRSRPESKVPLTWTQLEKMRRDDPTKYYQPDIQNYIFEQVGTMGTDFYKT